jgi:hypothetical protein
VQFTKVSWRRVSFAVAFALLVALTLLPAAQPAAPAAQECRGTLVLESFAILTDTDPNPPWTPIDQWTYHIYSWQNRNLKSYQDYSIAGDSGYFEQINLTLQQSVLLGAPGDQATLKLELWTKEKDPSRRPRGVPPADRGQITVSRTETCAPGEFRFSVFNDVFAQPTPPGADEHNGRVEFRWKWVLEVA